VWTPPITGCYSCCWTGFENRLRPFCTDSWYFTFQGSSVIFGSSDNTWNAAINWYPLHTDRVHGHAPTVLTNKVAFYEIERNSTCVLSLKTRTRVLSSRMMILQHATLVDRSWKVGTCPRRVTIGVVIREYDVG
jgi:hypothetical protein